jgi:hypothetical protein
MKDGSFHRVISEHLALRERNKGLERRMPLDRYREPYERAAAEERAKSPAPDDWPEVNDSVSVTPPRHDPDSWWDRSDERALPPSFEWDDD